MILGGLLSWNLFRVGTYHFYGKVVLTTGTRLTVLVLGILAALRGRLLDVADRALDDVTHLLRPREGPLDGGEQLLFRLALHHQFSARERQVYPHIVKRSIAQVPVGSLDQHLAGQEARVK